MPSYGRNFVSPNVPDELMTRRGFVGLTGAMGAALIAAGCGSSSSSSGAASGGSSSSGSTTLTVAQAIIAPTLDWENLRGFEDAQAIFNVYDQLWTLAPGTAGPGGALVMDTNPDHIQGLLAETATLSSDGKTTTVHLRQGVKSFFGNEMTADDVIWTIDRALSMPAGKFYYATILDIVPGSYHKVDQYTVSITQTRPNYLIRPLLAAFPGSIFDSTEVKKHATASDPYASKWTQMNDAGFGRYHVTSFVPGSTMIMEANPNYWGTKPYFTKISYQEVDSDSVRLALLLRGSVDVAESLTPAELNKGRHSSGARVFDADSSTLFLNIYANFDVPEFKNMQVRQAMAWAIPYDEIIKSVYFGHATQAKSQIPGVIFGSTAKYWPYTYDPDKAKSLLAGAGIGGKSFQMTYETARPEIGQVAEIVQSAWQAVGLNISLDPLPGASYSARLLKKAFQLALDETYPIVADPIYTSFTFYYSTSPYDWATVDDPNVDKIIQDAPSVLSLPQRVKLFDQLQKDLAGEMATIEIAWPGTHLATRSDITGYALWPDTTTRYYQLSRT